MTVLEWNADLMLGVDAMDHEHERLVRLMNRLHDQRAARAPRTEVARTLGMLRTATVDHFSHEERHMERIGFPAAGGHKRVHVKLLERFGEHYERFARGEDLTEEFLNFLRFWLSAHIRGVDRRYADHERGATRRSA